MTMFHRFKIQRLDLAPRAQASAARRLSVGRVWTNVARPKRNLATAERLVQFARVDNPDAIVRVR